MPGTEPQRGRAIVQAEGNPLALVVLLDRPTKTLVVKLLRPVHVFDPERDAADVWFHRSSPSLSHRLDFAYHYYDGTRTKNMTVADGGKLLSPDENDWNAQNGPFWCLAADRFLRH